MPVALLAIVPALVAALGCSSSSDGARCAGPKRDALVNGVAEESYLALGVEDTRALVRMYDGSGLSVSSCTAALIRPGWLVTARHCLQIEPLAIELRLADGSRTLRAIELDPHPELDAALIRFEPALVEGDAVRPFALESTPVDEQWLGERVELAGFGIAEHGLLPAEPRYAVETITEVRESALVVDGDGRSGACLGDSGGPLLVRNQLGKPAVLGILSTGSATCLHRDTYLRIDRLSEWIQAIAGVEEPESAGCGAVGEIGICSFGKALVCRDDVLEVTRCVGATVCGWDSIRATFACVTAAEDACRGAGSAGVCYMGVARECSEGVVSELNCGPCGECAYDPATGRPRCYAP
ncbi:MAG TPA: trypsin-like serine protease [Polyangiaceae bacterium]|nr:trypsin-like serine protease [Polyangiaceae bacterium]